MRLIDADALLQRAIPHGWSTPKWVSDITINDAPTVDAEPVRHGRWIYTGIRGRFPVCECSCCGNAENADWAILGDNVNYCPNCGARMDENETD